jgi:hypothetical protein
MSTHHARIGALLLLGASALSVASAAEKVVTRPLFAVPGVRSGAGLSTMVTCSNLGTQDGLVGIAAYSFNNAFVCSVGAAGIHPGETRTFAVEPIASMATSACAATGTTIDQGRIEIYAGSAGTTKFKCNASLIAKAGDPPTAMTRLTMYTANGAPFSDIIFADGFDP